MNYILVFIGGGLGSVTRLSFSKLFGTMHGGFPLGTFLSNVVSCLILGALTGLLFNKSASNTQLRMVVFIGTGFCGGFSTFSTFSLETFKLFNQGNFTAALANVFLNILVCYACIMAGFFLTRQFS